LLYLYHSSAPGAVPFIYSDLRDIQVNMKNNLILPSGEIFITIYTGPPVAPNWYNYKDVYNMTPALGTTIDIDLVLTTLTQFRPASDPILAIALHSNSGQQQVNCDVERVSFEILLPANNESQRVIVKLSNNFIVVDDKYWDLENNAVAKLGTTILPGFQISNFSPNIIAGTYPQSGTAEEVTSGAAWYLKGIYTEWAQTTANIWAPSGNTIEFTSNAVNPGVDTNGAAYIGCLGGVALTGTWNPQPFVWQISPSNQLIITHTNGLVITFSPLVDLPQPNNFTTIQEQSGCFSSSNVGTLNTTALISNSVASFKSPIFPVEIDLTFLSETQAIIRRSWEIVDTTYTITSGNVLSGQYISPTYPNNGNIDKPPDSYTMPTSWVVEADSSFQFEILFSGGLNNSLPAGSQNFRQMTVTPTPSEAGITFTWTANYYTEGNIFIGAVAGFTPTGLVSSFITGGSLKPPTAAYILYGCRSSQNIDAFVSLVFIEPEVPEPFELLFSQGLKNVITQDGAYSVSVDPAVVGVSYTYTAKFYDQNNVFLGDVPGIGTSGTSSLFNITISSLPLGTQYISYLCTSSEGYIAQVSLIIVVPCKPSNFRLDFSGGANDIIEVDGTYSVFPDPVESTATYAYSARFYDIEDNDLGAVPGIGLTGNVSSFTITHATLPPLYAYILYTCAATGGDQGGGSARLSITLLQTVEPNRPPHTTVSMEQSASMGYVNEDYTGSHKYLHEDNMTDLRLEVLDNNNEKKVCQNPLDYEIEVKYIGDI
jgi:hypothetical protein